MLLKLFGSRTNTNNLPPNPNPTLKEAVVGEKPLILQIIHIGGVVERYYMAFPAASIIDKYPNYVLARPEIFRQPWDSIVRPEEILFPGQKYFVVPVRTVKKLRRRVWNPRNEMTNSLVCQDKDANCNKSLSNVSVSFKGIESKTRNDSGAKKSSNGKRSRKIIVRFNPSLAVIDEAQSFAD